MEGLELDVMYDSVEKFYQNKRVFITGHTGFKGTWLCMLLEKMGGVVCGYSLAKDKDSFYIRSKAKVAFDYEADILDAEQLRRSIEDFKPEILIHLASHSSLEGNYDIPAQILMTNTAGVINVLESIRNIDSIKSAVIVTSDKCYLNSDKGELYTEESPLGASAPYSVSKVCQELITSCYQQSFFESTRKLGIATARACNAIGIGDFNRTRLLPYILECFSKGQTATLRNPDAIRAWQFVLDVLWGYLLLAKKLCDECNSNLYNGAYNFGPTDGEYWNVAKLVEVLAEQFECPKWSFENAPVTKRKESAILKLDSRKARETLIWKSNYSLTETMRLIGNFTIRNTKGEDFSELCREWIENYFAKLKNI